jgi:hypothetical protein
LGWLFEIGSMLENWIIAQVLSAILDFKVARVPQICTREINIPVEDLRVNNRTNENVVTQQILSVDEILIVVE